MYNEIIQYIKNRNDEFVKKWTEEVRQSEFMTHYVELPDEELVKRGEAVYSNLINWLKSGASNDSSEQYFESVGVERINEGFSLTEINYAFSLTKKVLFNSLLNEGEFQDKLDSKQSIELMFTLGNFFDLGNFYIVRGYSAQITKKLNESNKFSREEVEKIMSKSSLDSEELDSDDIIWRHVY